MALSQDTIAVLNEYQISGDYVHYYQIMNDAGDLYGAYGLGASTDGHSLASGGYIATDFAGVLANTFLENKYYEVTGNILTEAQKQSVRENLIIEDYRIRAANQGVANGDQIAKYHGEVFEKLGIPAEAWTATALQDIFGPPAWCYGCSPEVLQNQSILDVLTQLNTTVEAMKLAEFADDLIGTNPDGSDGVLYKALKEFLPTLIDIFKEHIQLVDDELHISDAINKLFIAARNWFQRRDPLTLDLDSDGLETVGIDPANPILFDHDGDGVANATGWIKPDDGFLVLDRNGNGLIDNGTELFGDSTPLVAGGTAADGFAALAQEDTNHDGLVNSNDANWDNLRVWQDANSDGITDAGELHSLESLGITGFHVAKSENTTRLGNGNQIADLGSYIRDDGTEGTVGQITGGMADIDLADNPFYRSFSDTVPLTEQAQALPTMQGSGMVRDLQEAVSLSPALGSALTDYAAADTKAAQMALVDAVISQWAASSGFQTSIEKAAA